jgi:Tfp pilus assembly protein PilO
MKSDLRLLIEIVLARHSSLLAAISILLLTAGIGAASMTRQHGIERELRAQMDALRARATSEEQAPVSTNAKRLAVFEQTLGQRAELDAYLRVVFENAQQRGLRLKLGEYRLAAVPPGRYQRYEMVLPVEGRFDAIQAFSQQVLLALPFAALDDIIVRRESVGSPVVEAKLRFALYLRPEAAAAHKEQQQ